MQKSYYNKVKMIYIDPPYNTGNDSFIYPDKFSETKEEYLRRIGDKDEAGLLMKEGLFRRNSKESGHYHSNWLSMMYPRLFLARNLLRDDGVIFISIDDNEVHNLRLMMNEIFGEENFVANVVWQKKYAASNDAKGIPAMHDHIVVYQKSTSFSRNLLPRTEKQDKAYKFDDGDGKGLWRTDNLLVKSFSESYVFPIVNPNTEKEYWPPNGSCWRGSKETIARWIEEKRIFFGKGGIGAPQLKRYLNEVQQGIVPTTWWKFEDAGHNDEANKELSAIFKGKAPFDTPKPSRLIKLMLQIATQPNEEHIVLDFFAGSGTTAQAVIEQNKEDGGNRKFILVQLPEKTGEESEAYKAGYKTIAEICKERIRRVIKRLNSDSFDLSDSHDEKENQTSNLFDSSDSNNQSNQKNHGNHSSDGFKVFKLAPSNFKIWRTDTIENEEDLKRQMEAFADPIKPTSEEENMAWEILIKSGYELTTPLERIEIADVLGYSIAEGEVILALEKITQKAIDAIVSRVADPTSKKPRRVICLDSLFARQTDRGQAGNDQLKTNTVLQMKDAGIEFKTI